jgi:hypothetical protein
VIQLSLESRAEPSDSTAVATQPWMLAR